MRQTLRAFSNFKTFITWKSVGHCYFNQGEFPYFFSLGGFPKRNSSAENTQWEGRLRVVWPSPDLPEGKSMGTPVTSTRLTEKQWLDLHQAKLLFQWSHWLAELEGGEVLVLFFFLIGLTVPQFPKPTNQNWVQSIPNYAGTDYVHCTLSPAPLLPYRRWDSHLPCLSPFWHEWFFLCAETALY